MRFHYKTGARPLDGYTIKRGVGIGGFGEVYYALSDAGKEVALKRVQRNLEVEVRGVTQCLNLKHHNLIALFDIKYDEQGEGWIVMEYVQGDSLKDVIERNPNGMPLDQVEQWFCGIAAGVAYLHDHGIVHRDLKPANIFTDEDMVKIGDYGLSKFISCSRRSGQTESVGTFHYMAPEIGKGVYGKEIDIYALGILLFEMLTGRVPFEGESSQEIIMKHLTADPVLDGVDERFRRVIERSLFKDPSKRFPSVAEMMQALRWGDCSPPPVRPPEPALRETTVPETRREPMYIGEDGTTDEIIFGPVVEVVPTQPGNKPPVIRPRPAPEPIAGAVHRGVRHTADWWRNANLSTPVKVLLVLAVVAVLVLTSEVLLPVALMFGLAYLIYFGIRAIGLAMGAGSATAATSTIAAGAPPPGGRTTRVTWRQRARLALARQPLSERMAQLTGSFLFSTLVAGVLGVVMLLLGGQSFDDSIETWSLFGWLMITSVSGAWAILFLGKFWERSSGDNMLRRFVMLIAGMGIGAVAWASSAALLVDLPDNQMIVVPDVPTEHIPASMYAADGTPQLPAYMVYFGGLFLILRWWRQTDPLRSTRLSLWATGVCIFWAGGMSVLWQFPQPWGFMVAATTSVAAQLAAPWMSAEERARIRHQVVEA